MENQAEIFFARELWKLLLEIEDMVRDRYRKLVEEARKKFMISTKKKKPILFNHRKSWFPTMGE